MVKLKGANGIVFALQQNLGLDSIRFTGGLLCKPNPRYFLEGVQVASTGYKERYQAYTFITPLWTIDRAAPKLNYGDRLHGGQAIYGNELDVQQLLALEIRQSELILNRLTGNECTPQAFIDRSFKRIDLDNVQHTLSLFDYTVGLLLAETSDKAVDNLETIISRKRASVQSEFFDDVELLLLHLHKGKSSIKAVVDSMAARGLNRLGSPLLLKTVRSGSSVLGDT